MRRLACLLLTVAACGGGDDAPVDLDAAPGADGAIADAMLDPPDAVPPDAMPAPVTVRARTRVGPFVGAPVVFYDAAGAVIANVTTDAAGEASAMVPPGGAVIAAPSNNARGGYLWVSPEPGDVLEMLAGEGTAPTATTTIVSPAVAGTALYRVDSECGSASDASTSVAMNYDQYPDCDVQDFILTRLPGTGSAQSIYAPAETVTAGGTIDLSGREFFGLVSITSTVVGIPATATSFDIESTLHHNGHVLGNRGSTSPTPSGGQASVTFSADDIPAASLLTVGSYVDAGSSVYLYELGDQVGASLDAAFAPSHLASGLYTDATDTLTWTYASGGQPPDGVFAELHFGSPPSFASAGGDAIIWYVLAPPGGEVVMPVIPAQFTYLSVATRPLTMLGLRAFRHTGGLAPVRTRAFGVGDPEELLTAPGTLGVSMRQFGPA